MSTKTKVSQIVIQFPDGSHKEIPIEDARALFNQLDELFGVNRNRDLPMMPVIIERERWPNWWYYPGMPYSQPCVHEPSRTTDPLPQIPTVWCCADGH